MTIALAGSSVGQPTPVYKIQFNGSILPGYGQAVDDPLVKRVTPRRVPYQSGGAGTALGADARSVRISMRLLTRLSRNTSSRARLDDLMEQYRDTLAIVDRVVEPTELYIGDSDRYLLATFVEASMPLTAPDHQAATYTLTFSAEAYYRATTATTNYREGIGPARITATLSGASAYDGRFSGSQALLFDASGEDVTYPAANNITTLEGTVALWMQPQFASTYSGANRPVTYLSGTTVGGGNDWYAGWRASDRRWAVYGSGSDGAKTYAVTNALTFASGNNVFMAWTWDSTGTKAYAGVAAGSFVSGSSATSLFDFIVPGTDLHLGGDETLFANSALSNVVTFRSALTAAQITTMFSASSAFVPTDADFPTTMLLDAPLNGSATVNSSSNNLYMDLGASRTTYPIITLSGTGRLAMSGTNTGKSFDYSGGAIPEVSIDCGALTCFDATGTTKVVNLQTVNFGIAFSGSHRVSLIATTISGSMRAGLSVTPRYER